MTHISKITKKEMSKDIREMILVIMSFTEKNTQGEEKVKEWVNKYTPEWNDILDEYIGYKEVE